MLMRYPDRPEPPQPGMVPAGLREKVTPATIRIGDAMVMASDARYKALQAFRVFSVDGDGK